MKFSRSFVDIFDCFHFPESPTLRHNPDTELCALLQSQEKKEFHQVSVFTVYEALHGRSENPERALCCCNVGPDNPGLCLLSQH